MPKKAKLIVIEGTDASGKQTQSELLYEFFKNENTKVVKLCFPDYESPSSALVKMYLNGDFGKTADSVDGKIASIFYAADRYASYKTKWEDVVNDPDAVIIFDRYVTSNMIHQAVKVTDQKEKDEFLSWLFDLEYGIFKLPQPDHIIFLNMPPEHAMALMRDRANKITNESAKDIHESDEAYLKACYDNACYVADKYHWTVVPCAKDGKVRPIAEIQEEIRKHVCN